MRLIAVAAISLLAGIASAQETRSNVDIIEALVMAPVSVAGQRPYPILERVTFLPCIVVNATLSSAQCLVENAGEYVLSVTLYYSEFDDAGTLQQLTPLDQKIEMIRNCFGDRARARCKARVTGAAFQQVDPKTGDGVFGVNVYGLEFLKAGK